MDMKDLKEKWDTSPTYEENVTRQLEGKFHLDPEILRSLRAKIGAEKLQTVTIQFSDTHIVQLDDETVMLLRDQYLTGSCARIVRELIGNQRCVTQPFEALRSDLFYQVEYSAEVSGDEKAELTDQIAGELSSEAKRIDRDKITGENLFFGIKLSNGCLVLNRPEAQPEQLSLYSLRPVSGRSTPPGR
jgi:hypothetical protein